MNEFDFIKRLREQTGSRRHSARVVTGIGDDASVIRQAPNRDLVVTTDLLVEGIDFHRHAAPASMLGHKALAVSLSDIAAMGARPFSALLSIGMPLDAWNGPIKDEFIAGFLALADQFGITLAGGDISEARDSIVIDSIVLGEVAAGAAVLRSGAHPGDQIFVTGKLGGAAAGLKLIEMGARVSEPPAVAGGPSAPIRENATEHSDDEAIQTLLLRQLRPQPRVGWAIVLGEEHLATAMIDISDGLSSDLNHLCNESSAGAIIDAASLPLDENVKTLCGRRALDPLMLALHGGEDFELLFTVAPENVSRLPKRVDGVAVSRIGEVTADRGVIKIKEQNRVWDLTPGGYEHFRRAHSQ